MKKIKETMNKCAKSNRSLKFILTSNSLDCIELNLNGGSLWK